MGKDAEWVSFSKLRGAYSIVGNGVPPFITYPVSYVTAGGDDTGKRCGPFRRDETGDDAFR